jgi:N-acetylneuraminic acid mutarotase
MVCVGGSDGERCYAEAFWLDYDHGQIRTTSLPALPTALSNACGARVGSVIYIAGGQTTNDAVKAVGSVFSLDLSKANASWKELPSIPGPGRILATAAAFLDGFYVFGGTALSEGKEHQPQREYLADAYRYSPDAGWKRVPDLPNTIVASPSPAPANATGIFILGGDDGSHVGFKPINLHPGFSKTILHFDPRSESWTTVGETPAARVTVPCVEWDGGWAIPGGEMRPGVRSPQVWMFHPEESR